MGPEDDEPNGFNLYNSQLDAFELYHAIQEEEASRRNRMPIGPALPALGHATAGSIATASTKLLLYPLDLVITRMQVKRQLRGSREAPSAASEAAAEYKSLTDAARKIHRSEGGLRAFYTGCGPDVAKSFVDAFLFFLIYTSIREARLRKAGGDTAKGRQLSVSAELLIGMAAGAFSRFITTPVQNIVTRQQTAALVAARDPESIAPEMWSQLSVKDIALQIRDERGLSGFWAGYGANILLTVNPAITFAMHSLLLRLSLPRRKRDKPGPYVTFTIAAISKAIATAVTYPISLAKSRAQVSSPDHEDETKKVAPHKEEEPFSSSSRINRRAYGIKANAVIQTLSMLLRAQYRIFKSLQSIFQREGLQGLYSGLQAEMLKGFLSHGLTMMMKESVHIGVIQLYYVLLKLSKKWPPVVQEAAWNVKEKLQNAA